MHALNSFLATSCVADTVTRSDTRVPVISSRKPKLWWAGFVRRAPRNCVKWRNFVVHVHPSQELLITRVLERIVEARRPSEQLLVAKLLCQERARGRRSVDQTVPFCIFVQCFTCCLKRGVVFRVIQQVTAPAATTCDIALHRVLILHFSVIVPVKI